MEVTLVRADNLVIVDGQAKTVDLTGLNPSYDVVHWDDARQTGVIQYTRGVTVMISQRDIPAEDAENARRRARNQPILEEPIFSQVEVRKPNQPISSFADFQPWLDAWVATPFPQPAEADPAVQEALVQSESERRVALNEVVGQITPETIATVKTMSRADARVWFDVNFTDNASLRRAVRWMFLYFIRRVL